MSILAYQMNDPNLRHAAKTFKNAKAPIFTTQTTEAERAELEAQQKEWLMEKRLAEILEPANALSQATMPAKLLRSLSKEKKRNRPMKRRPRVCSFFLDNDMLLVLFLVLVQYCMQTYVRSSSPFIRNNNAAFFWLKKL